MDPTEFIDYRDYLAEVYKARKSERSWYSYKMMGDKVGMDASLVAKVLSKARHIADDSIARFAQACGLEGQGADYFTAMVHFTKAKEDVEAKEWFERMLALRTHEVRKLEGEAYAFYQKWHHTAIRAALDYFDCDGSDLQALADHLRPSISVEEVQSSLQLLADLGLVAKDENGLWRPTEKGVTTGTGWKSVAVHTFQSETLRLALEALERVPKGQRNYSTLTMSLSAEDYDDLKERVRDFRRQVAKFIHTRGKGDRVVQMNIQLLPLTECGGEL